MSAAIIAKMSPAGDKPKSERQANKRTDKPKADKISKIVFDLELEYQAFLKLVARWDAALSRDDYRAPNGTCGIARRKHRLRIQSGGGAVTIDETKRRVARSAKRFESHSVWLLPQGGRSFSIEQCHFNHGKKCKQGYFYVQLTAGHRKASDRFPLTRRFTIDEEVAA